MVHRPIRAAHRAFTMIELLVVLAIIAILVALLFPAFAKAKEYTKRSECMTQMQQIQSSLAQYYLDNERYPAALLGLAQTAGSPQPFFTGSGLPVALTSLSYSPLIKSRQKYLQSVSPFTCPDNPATDPAAVPPSVKFPALPGITLAGDYLYTADMVRAIGGSAALGSASQAPPAVGRKAFFYLMDSYDMGPAINAEGATSPPTSEVHYALDWTGGNGGTDARNQLKYGRQAPPDSTVITWCTYHVAVNKSGQVPVLFLNGHAKSVPVSEFLAKGPLGLAPR